MLPTATALGLWIGRRELAALIAVRDVRSLFVGQLIVTAWSVGWLSLVVSYSGGDWTGDWFGQWERTRFFLERWPRDVLFFGIDPMPSRPPLVNLTVSTWLALTHGDFAHYQLFLTMWGSLVYAPAALLARRFSDARMASRSAMYSLWEGSPGSGGLVMSPTITWPPTFAHSEICLLYTSPSPRD